MYVISVFDRLRLPPSLLDKINFFKYLVFYCPLFSVGMNNENAIQNFFPVVSLPPW